MPFNSFIRFILPSFVAMILFIALPLIGVGVLSVHNSFTKTEFKEVKIQTPMGSRIEQQPQPVLDKQGKPVIVEEYVGMRHYDSLLDLNSIKTAFTKYSNNEINISKLYNDVTRIPFWGALEFTLIYTVITTPFILILGFLVALGVFNTTKKMRGSLIFFTLLPFIITPVVGSLSIKWLFLDHSIVTYALQYLGLGKIYFLQNAFTIRFLIILYGIWHVLPFAFIVLYAGLQTVSQDLIESAQIDGASRIDLIKHVIVPHLSPLIMFIILIHVMDSYRVFEPILVFSGGQGANSLQFLTYYFLDTEQNYHKAGASALLTLLGILFILVPILYKTWNEQRKEA